MIDFPKSGQCKFGDMDIERRQVPQIPALLVFVIAITAISMLSIECWSINRGFDLQDEGLYHLLYSNPTSYATWFSSFHLMLTKIPKFTSEPIFQYRLLKIGAETVSATVLSMGFCFWGKKHLNLKDRRAVICLWLISIIGNCVAFAILPRTISYNGATAFLLFVATGLLLYAHSLELTDYRSRSLNQGALLVTGICIGLSFFLKAPSAVLFLIISIGIFKKRGLLWVFSGLWLGLIIYFAGVDPPQEWLTRLQMYGFQSQESRHSIVQLVHDYALDTVKVIARAVVVCIPGLLALYAATKVKTDMKLVISSMALLLVSSAYIVVSRHFYKADCFYEFGFFAVGAVLIYKDRFSISFNRENIFAPVVLLGSLPFVISGGTNTPLFYHAATNIAPWLLLTSMSVLICKHWNPLLFTVTNSVICAFTFWYFVYGGVFHPFLLPEALTNQTVPGPVGTHLTRLYVDHQTHHMLEELKRRLETGGFREGDPVLALNFLPGMVYAVGGRSSALVLFDARSHRSIEAALQRLNSQRDGKERLFVILSSDSGWALAPESSAVFEKFGLKFPDKFNKLGVVRRSADSPPVAVVYGLAQRD